LNIYKRMSLSKYIADPDGSILNHFQISASTVCHVHTNDIPAGGGLRYTRTTDERFSEIAVSKSGWVSL
jgi:hypothetical protein